MEQVFTGDSRNGSQKRELRVVFLGDGDAGKSHILTRLLCGGSKIDDFSGTNTPGITIHSKDFHIGERHTQVHFWDFGGQDILHSIYRMFLTKRTLYVVVLNARDYTTDDRARYWLHTIYTFAAGAPVFLVLNKCDQNPYASINERDLHRRYPNLTQIVKLSALADSQETFRRNFFDPLLQQIDTCAITLSAAYLALKQQLAAMPDAYIDIRDFERLCSEQGIADSQEILDQFHDLGFLFRCWAGFRTRNYLVLRPAWIGNAVLCILFEGYRDSSDGVVSLDRIDALLTTPPRNPSFFRSDTIYALEDVDYILQVMRAYRLSFSLDDQREFIPMLSAPDCPPIADTYRNDPDALEFRIRYDYLPATLIHMLMVDMRRDLDIRNSWRWGAHFFSDSCGLSALVQAEGDRLHILVRSRDQLHSAYTYMMQILSAVESISLHLGLEITRREVIYKADGIAEAFDYDVLTKSLARGMTTVFSVERMDNINIRDILSQTDDAARTANEKLVRDILRCCAQLQDIGFYLDAHEDVRNDFLREYLRSGGYIVQDQTRSGTAGTGKRAGELDLVICTDQYTPWAACEAMNIHGSQPRGSWDAHLRKLLEYHSVQHLLNFLICYVDCPMDKFRLVCDGYLSHIQDHPGFYPLQSCSVVNTDPYRAIFAARCIYDQSGFPAEVYHIFVHMGQ